MAAGSGQSPGGGAGSGDGNREAVSRRDVMEKRSMGLLKVKEKLSRKTCGFLAWVDWWRGRMIGSTGESG